MGSPARSIGIGAFLAVSLALSSAPAAQTERTARLDPIVYTISVPDPASHVARVEARIPTGGRQTIDLMLPTWTPGYYKPADYSSDLDGLLARSTDGDIIGTGKTGANRWHIQTGGRPLVVVTYRLNCASPSPTGNRVDADRLILNGAATFVTMIEPTSRPVEVYLELAPTWKLSMTALDPAPDKKADHYAAPDFDTLVDSPIVAGDLGVHTFEAGTTRLSLVDLGAPAAWDAVAAVRQLKGAVDQATKLWGTPPFKRYVFLNVFGEGAGNLGHRASALLTSAPDMAIPTGEWLEGATRAYVQAFNGRRLRPIELGLVDYEYPPASPSLWAPEGLSSYYADLLVNRSPAGSPANFLTRLSARIRELQTTAGRLAQTLEDASRGVWHAPAVGAAPAKTVPYDTKGAVVGFLLDAHIRRVTAARRSLDDVMRLAYQRFGTQRGFRPAEFQAVASEVANDNLTDWFHQALATTQELDYAEALEWYGLQFVEPGATDPERAWTLEVKSDATAAQKQHLAALLGR